MASTFVGNNSYPCRSHHGDQYAVYDAPYYSGGSRVNFKKNIIQDSESKYAVLKRNAVITNRSSAGAVHLSFADEIESLLEATPITEAERLIQDILSACESSQINVIDRGKIITFFNENEHSLTFIQKILRQFSIVFSANPTNIYLGYVDAENSPLKGKLRLVYICDSLPDLIEKSKLLLPMYSGFTQSDNQILHKLFIGTDLFIDEF